MKKFVLLLLKLLRTLSTMDPVMLALIVVGMALSVVGLALLIIYTQSCG